MTLNRALSRLALGLALLAAAWPATAEPRPSALVLEWKRRLEAADTALRAGEWQRGRNLARKVLAEMYDQILDGEDVSKALGTTLTFLAVGEAGAGEQDAALWHWQTAQQLFPDAQRFDLAPFGAPGQWLKEQKLKTYEAPSELPRAPISETIHVIGGEIQAPKKRSAPLPDYPEAMRQARKELLVILSVVIDEQGKVSNPQVLKSSGAPTMVLASLEAVRRWTFRPALLNGKPVKVFYTLTVNFRLQG